MYLPITNQLIHEIEAFFAAAYEYFAKGINCNIQKSG
jgi:hypothetical protein